MDFLVFLQSEFDSSQDQEGAKDVDDPMKLINQRDARKDEDSSKYQGAQD